MDAIQSKLTYILFYNVFTIKTVVSKTISKVQLSQLLINKIYQITYIMFYSK